MLNVETKKAALARLESTVARYQDIAVQVGDAATALHGIRAEVGCQVIVAAEAYVNQLANSPKEFRKTVGELRIQYDRFAHVVAEYTDQSDRVSTMGASVTGVGVGAGVGVAALAPTAAMAIATTFGAASTGTAISALSGVAATNAAMAWLGGGALAAGGGGMVAGEALLALAGPVGWTIAGFALAGSAVYANAKNQELARKATTEALRIEARISTLNVVLVEITQLSKLTQSHAAGASALLRELESAPRDYSAFTTDQVHKLGALINDIRSLSELLNRTVTA